VGNHPGLPGPGDHLAKKYPNADREPGWQYLFPASSRAMDPRGGVERRHHQHEAVLQRAVRSAVRMAGVSKPDRAQGEQGSGGHSELPS
jgi:hypothetical protein